MQHRITFSSVFMSMILTVSANTNQDSPSGNVTFWLYTRLNPNSPSKFIPNNDTTIGNYNPLNDNKIIIHGYYHNRNKQWLHTMKDAFLQKEDVNVILVDWGPLAANPLYPKAVSYTKPVGEYIATLITYLTTLGSTFSRQHIIGHSLGAHIAGFAGTSLGGQLAHITGLDPAGPMFEKNDIDGKLDKSDALFVDALHTNAGKLIQGSLGVIKPVGHIDFFPSGGKRQPGCLHPILQILGIPVDVIMQGVCSHSRVHFFYTESILNTHAFVSYPCSNYTSYSAGYCTSCGPDGCRNMGYASEAGQTGVYYLATRSTQPYSGKHIFVVLNISPNQTAIRGQIFLTVV